MAFSPLFEGRHTFFQASATRHDASATKHDGSPTCRDNPATRFPCAVRRPLSPPPRCGERHGEATRNATGTTGWWRAGSLPPDTRGGIAVTARRYTERSCKTGIWKSRHPDRRRDFVAVCPSSLSWDKASPFPRPWPSFGRCPPVFRFAGDRGMPTPRAVRPDRAAKWRVRPPSGQASKRDAPDGRPTLPDGNGTATSGPPSPPAAQTVRRQCWRSARYAR